MRLSTLVLSSVFLLSVFLVVQFFVAVITARTGAGAAQRQDRPAERTLLSLEKLGSSISTNRSRSCGGLASSKAERVAQGPLRNSRRPRHDAPGPRRRTQQALDSESYIGVARWCRSRC